MGNSEWWRYQAVGLIALVAIVGAACGQTSPTPTPATSSLVPIGVPMALYESAEHPFSIQYPAEWIEHPEVQNGEIVVWRTGSQGEWFVIVEGSTVYGEGLSAYVDAVISIDRQTDPQHEMVSREQTATVQGLSTELLEYTLYGGAHTVSALIYLHDNRIGFRTAYGAPTPRYEEMQDMIAYSFGTFQATK